MTQSHCPRCGNRDITGRKHKPPGQPRSFHEFFCGNCKLLETVAGDDPKWLEVIRRWEDAPPYADKTLEELEARFLELDGALATLVADSYPLHDFEVREYEELRAEIERRRRDR